MAIIPTGVWPIDANVTTGTELAVYLNDLLTAYNSTQASPTRPPLLLKGGLWAKLTGVAGDVSIMVYDGASDYEIGSVISGTFSISGSASISPTAPTGAVAGQTWIDTSIAGAPVLRVYSGTNWLSVNAQTVSGTAPVGTATTPLTAGMLWVDNSIAGAPILKVYNGTTWVPTGGGVTSGTAAPTVPAPVRGDAWVNTSVAAHPVIMVYNGTTWLPAGMPVASGTAPSSPYTGLTWVDTSTATKPVLKMWNGSAWMAAGPQIHSWCNWRSSRRYDRR